VRFRFVFLGLALPGPGARHAAAEETDRHGWDHPNAGQFRANLAVMEKRPFDGTVIVACGEDAGKPKGLGPAFSAEPWQRRWFQGCVDDLRAASRPGSAITSS